MAGLMIQEVVLGDREFRLISDLVYEHCGINLHDGKKELVRARLAKRLREGNFRTFSEYIRYVLEDPTGGEFAILVEDVEEDADQILSRGAALRVLAQPRAAPAVGIEGEPSQLPHSRLERGLLLGRGAVLHRHDAPGRRA